jgi:hypothetical protein
MARRVRDFIRAHPSEGPGDTAALNRFEELLARAERLLAQQRNGLAAARTAASQRRALRQALQSKLIRYLLAVGNLAAKDRRELAEQFRLPEDTASHEAFLNGVKGLLEKAGAQKDLLVSMGMSHTCW